MKIRKLVTISFLFLLLFLSVDSINVSIVGIDTVYISSVIYFVMLISAVIYLGKTDSFLNLQNIAILVILLSICVASLLANMSSSGGAFFYMLLLFLVFSSLLLLDVENFFSYYCKVIDVICIISIITMLAIFFAPSVLSVFPTYENEAGTLFSYFFIGAFLDLSIGGSTRAIGIFREPGVFAVYIIIGFILDNYLNERKKNRYIIYSVALLLTQSTSGYFSFLILCLPKITKLMFKSGQSRTKYLVIFCIGIVLWALNYFGIYDAIGDKFSENSNTYSTYLSRFASIIANLNIISNNLFFGSGFDVYNDLFSQNTLKTIGVALDSGSQSTNSWLAQGAIWGSIMLLFNITLFIVSSIKLAGGRKFDGMIIFVTMLMLFSSQDMRFSYLFNMLLFIGVFMSSKNYNSQK